MVGKFRIDIFENGRWKGKAFVECRLFKDFVTEKWVVDQDELDKKIQERFPSNYGRKGISFDVERVR